MLFRQGLRLSLIGLLVGLPLSIAGMFAIERMIGMTTDGDALGVSPLFIGASIALVVVAVASLATWLPARRAARVDPMIALRSE